MSFAAYVWFGNASGPGSVQNTDRTGSPVSPGYCGVSSCHGGGDFGTNVAIQLLDENRDTITEYIPATTYTLRISIAATGAEGFGFQAVALTESNAGAGEFGVPADGTQVITISNRDYAEHSSRSNTNSFEIDWTAPDAGSGAITFYAAGNAVNGDFDFTGDDPDTSSLNIMEGLSSGLRDQIANQLNLRIFPSLPQSIITAQWSREVTVDKIAINDLTGQTYYVENIKSGSITEMNIPVYNLPAGIYFVRLLTSKGFQTQKFVKI
jgi:hypothetical protein